MTQMTLFLNHESYFEKHIYTQGYVCEIENSNIALENTSFALCRQSSGGIWGTKALSPARPLNSSNPRQNGCNHRLKVASLAKSLIEKRLNT